MPRRLALLVVLAACLVPAAPASAAIVPEPSTPELIERAVERGELSRAEGLKLLADAILRPGTIPERFVSYAPWDGTMHLKRIQEEAPRLLADPQRPLDPSLNCFVDSAGPLPQAIESDHFFIEYAADETFGGGLTIEDYADSLDGAWDHQVDTFGYAAPPILEGTPYGKYNVRVQQLQPGLYGYVTPLGTYGGEVGDNPATPWTEDDALATCMVLNSDYELFFEQLTVGTARQRLDATTAHEFLHSIQYGMGALDNGDHEPDLQFSEGHATWMEDEVYDGADDNHNYLYPTFEDSLGEHDDGSPYSYWLTWRGLLERFGTGTPGEHEQIIQRFWEITSREEFASIDALHVALAPTGLSLAQGFHDYAIAARFLKPCGGAYALPHCFEEADSFASVAGGRPEPHGEITGLGGHHGTEDEPAEIEDNYALNWIDLPPNAIPVEARLEHHGDDGDLRMSVICDTGSGLRISPAVVAGGGETETVRFDPTGCQSRASAVITNEKQTGANPEESTFTPYALRADAAPPEPPAEQAPAPPAEPPRQPVVPFIAPPPPAPVPCSAGSRLAAAAATPLGRGLAFVFRPRNGARVDVEVFQSSVRDRVVEGRVVARFRRRARSFAWDGVSNLRGRRLRNGYFFVRFRARNASGVDVRRVAVRRTRGRFFARPGFARSDRCGDLVAYKLLRPVFGGRRSRAAWVSYRLGAPARVTIEVIERGVIVRRVRHGLRLPGQAHRLRVSARPFIRGDVTFRLRVEREGRRPLVARLVARRL